MTTVKEFWIDFADGVVEPTNLSREVSKKCFYAGAWAVYLLMISSVILHNESETLKGIHKELNEFTKDLRKEIKQHENIQ